MILKLSSRWLLPPTHPSTDLFVIPALNYLWETYVLSFTDQAPGLNRTLVHTTQLPYRVRWQDLKDLFRRAGTVLRADVSLGPDNRSRGYGTVLLATAEDAGRAIDMFNGYCWQTRVLEVRPDRLGTSLDLDTNSNSSMAPVLAPFVQPVFIEHAGGTNGMMNGLDDMATAIGWDGELPSGGTGMRSLFVGNVRLFFRFRYAGHRCPKSRFPPAT